MIKRLWNLITLQIGDKFNFDKKKNILPLIYKILGFIVVGVATYLFLMLLENYIYLKPTNSMILLIIFVSQVLTLLVNSMQLTESLYNSKDNAILLSLPAKHNEIFLSKISVFYLLELYPNVIFLLPILVGFGIYMKQQFVYFVFSIVISFLLPLVSVLIGALLSIPLSFITKLLKKVSFIYIILFVLAFAGLFYIAKGIIDQIPNPLRFLAIYNKIVSVVLSTIDKADEFALFYEWFSNFIFGINPLENFGFIVLLILGLILLNVFISRPLFFRLAASNSENAVMKNSKGVNKESKTTFGSFYKKELLISIRTFGNVVENYILVVFMPLFLYIFDGIMNSFDLSTFGHQCVLGFNIMIGLLVMLSSNGASAKALSEEGSEFVLLKTSPVDTKLIAWAKILNNIIISFILLAISMVILGIMKVFTFKDIIIIFISIFVINSGHIMWSFQLDLRNPQIKDVSLFGKISNKENITKSLTLCVIVSLIFGALAVLLNYVGLMAVFFILVGCFFIWRLVVFDANLKSYFYEIEL